LRRAYSPIIVHTLRHRLVVAARRMLHEQGVERTTLADIAKAADVPVGNVYYYFKTKDELISAVIDAYGHDYDTLVATLEQQHTPQARLKALIRTWTDARERLTQYGCPIGTLSAELGKRVDGLDREAASMLTRLIAWAQEQFRQLGRSDARDLAVALIASHEGVVLIANALGDPDLIATEGRRLERWIDSIS
jgi:TetR/AcrR family transcriptional regulator, transcriptional repressor for nem operon